MRTIEDIRANTNEPKHAPRWVQWVLIRTWLVVIPIVAFNYAQSKKVEPAVHEIDQAIQKLSVERETSRLAVLGDANRLGMRISQLQALADTFQVRFDQVQAVLDSVRSVQAKDIAERNALQSEIDSLRSVYSQSSGSTVQKSERLSRLQNRVDSLHVVIEDRTRQAARLEAEASTNRDLRERVLDPHRFQDPHALVDGPGDYPNRDAMKKR